MRDLYINLELHNCANLKNPEDVYKVIKLVIDRNNLIPLSKERVEIAPKQLAHKTANDLDKWFQSNHYYRDSWDSENFSTLRPSERFGFYFRTTLKDEWNTPEPYFGSVELHLDVNKYEDTYNFLLFSTTFFGVNHLLNDPELGWIPNKTAQVLVDIADVIIPLVLPAYGAITHKKYLNTYGHDVLSSKWNYIHWFNFFGRTYVDRYGKDFLLEAPVWKSRLINNEGVVIHLAPDFVSMEPINNEAGILEYFNQQVNVELTWP